jgi:hypothetical protein
MTTSKIINLKDAAGDRAAAQGKRRRREQAKRLGRYEDWADEDDAYLLDELQRGFYEHDMRPMIAVAGLQIALQAVDAHLADRNVAQGVLNGLWLTADVLLTMHHNDMDEPTRVALTRLWEVTKRTAVPEEGWYKAVVADAGFEDNNGDDDDGNH